MPKIRTLTHFFLKPNDITYSVLINYKNLTRNEKSLKKRPKVQQREKRPLKAKKRPKIKNRKLIVFENDIPSWKIAQNDRHEDLSKALQKNREAGE